MAPAILPQLPDRLPLNIAAQIFWWRDPVERAAPGRRARSVGHYGARSKFRANALRGNASEVRACERDASLRIFMLPAPATTVGYAPWGNSGGVSLWKSTK